MEQLLTWLSKHINPIQWSKWFCGEIIYLFGHRDIIKVKDESLEATRQFSRDVILHRDELRTQLADTKKERDSFKDSVKFLESKINDRDAVMVKVVSAIDHQINELHKITKKVDRFLLYKMFIRLFVIRFGMIDSKRLNLIESAAMDILTDEEIYEWLGIISKISEVATENQARPLVALQFLMEEKVSAISSTKS